jgi:predicted amidohydrolase
MEFRVAGIQMPVGDDIAVNVQHIIKAIELAAVEKAEILLTPEGSLSGYRHDFDPIAVYDGLRTVTELAKNRGVGLALGTCFVEDDGQCYNQIRFYTAEGKYLGFHAKILRCGTLTLPSIGEINHYGLSELRTFDWHPGLTVGGLICNDLWANPECTPMPDPHLSQHLSRKGVQIVFHAVNGGRDGSEWSQVAWHYHEANLRMRAHAGGLWIITVDNCAPEELLCSAPSGVISPQGNWMFKTKPQGEQFFVYTIHGIGNISF